MTKAADFPVSEFRSEIKAFESSVGPRAEVYISVELTDGPLFYATFYSRGICQSGGSDFRVDADDLPGVLLALKNKWAEYAEKHRGEITRKMALAIIRITAELGECTDAALRNCGEFDPAQIKMYGEQACGDANDIAGRGPFQIVTLGGANAPAEVA